jgi:hypothetical protein
VEPAPRAFAGLVGVGNGGDRGGGGDRDRDEERRGREEPQGGASHRER